MCAPSDSSIEVLTPRTSACDCIWKWVALKSSFNFYAEYIIRNAGLDEAQAGIKIAGKNINNFRYVDDTVFMAESKEELKSLLVKEENEYAG